MPDLDLFQRALGLQPPWEVVEDKFDAEHKRLDLRIDFPKVASPAVVALPRRTRVADLSQYSQPRLWMSHLQPTTSRQATEQCRPSIADWR